VIYRRPWTATILYFVLRGDGREAQGLYEQLSDVMQPESNP